MSRSPRRGSSLPARHRALLACVSLLSFSLLAACSYIIDLPSSALVPAADAGDGDVQPLDANQYVDPDGEPLAPPPPFCASRTSPSLLCEDFDEGAGPDVGRDSGVVTTNRGELQVVNAVSFSPPRSLLAKATGNDTSALFVPKWSGSPPTLAASATILVSTFASTSADLMRIALTPNASDGGTGKCFVRLTATANWAVTQVCTDAASVETARLVTDSGRPVERRQWRRFVLALTELGTITLTIDGALVVNVTAVDPMFPVPAPESAGFGIERSADGSLAVFYDDLLVTHTP